MKLNAYRVLALLVSLGPATADAIGFAAQVSPPRFELRARPGEVQRQIIEVGNGAPHPVTYRIHTADWDLDPHGGIILHSRQLQPGSCRPWTRLERPTLKLGPGVFRRYRFEVHVPEGVPPRECRFAVVLDAPEALHPADAGQMRLPVTGRIAVVVYVAVGDVAPQLALKGLRMRGEGATRRIVATFHNSGTAHARPQGVLDGLAGDGQRYELLLSPLPVLPGEERELALIPKLPDGSDADGPPALPLQVRGRLEWEGGQLPVDVTLR